VFRKLSVLPVLLAVFSLTSAAAPPGAAALGLSNRQVARAAPHRTARPTAHRARQSQSQSQAGPAAACPGADAAEAPVPEQEQTMRCLVDFARRAAGRPALADSAELDRSAEAKSTDLLRCDEFSHFACGREFTYWMKVSGYLPARCWRVGENLAMVSGPDVTVRTVFGLWMHSPGHRRNILGDYRQLGLGLRIGALDGQQGAHVWTQHFGSHCG
jgi:uncharacterized protein YkwD